MRKIDGIESALLLGMVALLFKLVAALCALMAALQGGAR
jgi:hypothetical protein